MVSKTSISAIRTLIFIAQQPPHAVLSPRFIASQLNESPSDLAKVTRQLVKAGILRAEKGVKGGVRLARKPQAVTLLAVLEACQGAFVGDVCRSDCDGSSACSYHQAATELHGAIVHVLSKWSLAQLLRKPRPSAGRKDQACVIAGGARSGALFSIGGVPPLP